MVRSAVILAESCSADANCTSERAAEPSNTKTRSIAAKAQMAGTVEVVGMVLVTVVLVVVDGALGVGVGCRELDGSTAVEDSDMDAANDVEVVGGTEMVVEVVDVPEAVTLIVSAPYSPSPM